ncbi:MAG: TVP38/TMEM64 family protein [Clostridia bacterium]
MKKKIFKILLLLIVYILISVVCYEFLKFWGLDDIGEIRDFVELKGIIGYVVFFLFQLIVSTFICIIPFEDEFLTGCAVVLFGPVKGFLVASINMFVTSNIQFIIGRYFCKSMVAKLVGGDSIEKYQNYLSIKGEIMLPILYAIPLFPHDSLCLLAGMSKMKCWYFALVTLIMRSLEVAVICFLGSGLINFSEFTIFDWITAINLVIIDIYLLFKLKVCIENKINSRNSR